MQLAGQGLATVFMGPPGEAQAVRSVLQAKGIPAFIPDDWMRTLAPFETGGLLLLDRAVQVAPEAVSVALDCLANRDEETPLREGEEELPADFFDEQHGPNAELHERAMRISRRIRAGALAPYLAPFILWQFKEYLDVVRELGQNPPNYRWTLFGAGFSVVYFAVLLIFVLRLWN